MASYDNTVKGRNTLFAAICAALGVSPKWEPAAHPDHSKGRPSVGTGGKDSILGAVAHMLCNSKQTQEVASLFERNPTFEGVTRQDLYACGSSVRILGENGGHKSVTVADKLTGAELEAAQLATRQALGMTGELVAIVHTKKPELKQVVAALNLSAKDRFMARVAAASPAPTKGKGKGGKGRNKGPAPKVELDKWAKEDLLQKAGLSELNALSESLKGETE